MRCTFGCRKQFKKQADLARHVQFKHSQAVRQALAATSVAEQDTTTKTTKTLEEGYEDIENEIPSPDLQAIEDNNMDNEFDDFPDEIPELHSRYGLLSFLYFYAANVSWKAFLSTIPFPIMSCLLLHTSTIWSMRDLIRLRLQDSSLQSNFAYCFTKQFNSAGERLYDEAYSGDYCEELQNQLPNGATPLLVIFSSDAALATKIGKQSFHPLILDFGMRLLIFFLT
ncbi:hypothetical protein BDR26DRAFT_899968 [Obelidium mucronatum]|nr:hypothetical protein BDR26DRAFT_899968 [Obelidium mucronatum]